MPKDCLFNFSHNNESFVTGLLSEKQKKHFIFGRFVPHSKLDSKFWNLGTKQTKNAAKAGKLIVLDSMYEGFSTIYDLPKLSQIYNQCDVHSIHPSQIVYVTMNLVEHENLENYAEMFDFPKIQVLNLPFGQYELFKNLAKGKEQSETETILENTKKQFRELYQGKILLNLNNRYRQPRSFLAFYLASSPIKEYCLISHNEKYKKSQVNNWVQLSNRTQKQEKQWSKKTPIIIDSKITTNPDLHQSTVFELVSETLTNDWYGTSREYSEKTFRPIVNFQPFVIYGQKGCNHYLKKLGYKTYEDWFDLSFDYIDDPIERLLGLYRSIEQVTIKLSKLSKQQQLRWRFKNEAVLKHNYECFFKNVDNIREKTRAFFSEIASQNC